MEFLGGFSAARRMAKKSTPAALQTEVSTDEEWSKVLERKGLVVVDVHSEWSGPCTGMVSILKKIKMEIGGDTLSYATAKCDGIKDLERFRDKCEPTWMFIHNGLMVNLMFGAHCPALQKMLTEELRKVQNNEPHEFSIPVTQRSPEEEKREQILEEARLAKEAAKRAQEEAEVKAKYEAEMSHFTNALANETCLFLYPWVFKDEEGHRRDKKSSPPYMELVEELLPGNYSVCESFRKQLDEETIDSFLKESDYEMTEDAKQLLMEGKCMFMRLKISEKKPEMDVEKYLLNIIFGQPTLPRLDEPLIEGCYAERHKPVFVPSGREESIFPLVWAPPNPRSKATIFRIIFRKYIDECHSFEDKSTKLPIIVFKYDSTKKSDLKMVLDNYRADVINFSIFDRDKPPEAKCIATAVEDFEQMDGEKTGFEAFVCVVKKINSESFLAFAGIGPYHVSESPEKARAEASLYFPTIRAVEEVPSDDEDKPEETEENGEPAATGEPGAVVST